MWYDLVDQVYLINLPTRHDRLVDSIVTLNSFKIPFRRWVAIKRDSGEKGLKETMKNLFEHCIAMDYKRVVVFEDDIQFLEDPDKYLPSITLTSHFDLFYFGCNLLLPPERVSENLLKIKAAYSTHAVMYSRKAMEKILIYIDEEQAYDQILVKWIQNEGESYCSFPMIATQRRSVSDIAKFEDYKNSPSAKNYLDLEKGIILWDVMMKERFEQMTINI